MTTRIVSLSIDRDSDIILARQRTRKIAQMLGFDPQDATRITTAVSEIVRNALEYGKGGRIEYYLHSDPGQALEIVVADKGPGIVDLAAVLSGSHRSATGMGVGIIGARRLMDAFSITSGAGGTQVRMTKALPKRAPAVSKGTLNELASALAAEEKLDPIAEIRRQNQDMVLQFDELQKRQEELQGVNQELQDTNRGVVALYAELEERADHLRRADQLKSRFLSNMSHEFRTPLNSILSLSRMLISRNDGPLTPEQEKQVHFIRKSAENLTELVNDLLDLARIEAGKTVVAPKSFTVADLFGALRGMLRPLLVGDAVNLVFEEDKVMPPLYTDEGKVSQILRNFISNAIKFTERGEIRVSAERDDHDRVTFAVADTGIGVSAEHMESIWEEFSQVQNRLQAKVKGTGLGLPLAKRFAALLGGQVAVKSEVGAGSTFSLTIPRELPSAIAEAQREWTLDPARAPVLVIEDNAADAFTVERALALTRYQALPARTLMEARRALDLTAPVAIILDVVLEAEDSWRFLIELKHSETYRQIPVIVVSSSDEHRKAVSFGADGYLDKPVDMAQLLTLLDDFTGAVSATKVLLVDDEEVSRYLVRQLLPRGAFSLSEAATGREGLEAVKENHPDVILLDVNMPEMSGAEFLERLQAYNGAAPPAIVITSMILDDAMRARLRGAARIMSKLDLTTDALVVAIRESLSKAR